MLRDTGERIIPKEMKPSNGMLLEHLARYYFAISYAKGRVLDIACGTGYGAQMIAKAKKKELEEVLGVDLDANTIEYARKTYNHPLLHFQRGDALDKNLKQTIGTFDTILSFETIEHVPDDKAFFHNILALLKPGGTLVLSTPFGQGRGKPSLSPFHYHQLTEKEFCTLFTEQVGALDDIQLYYQQGVAFENVKRPGVNYPFGIAIVKTK